MRATINIPDELIQAIQRATGLKSKTDAIVVAMKDFLKARKRDHLRSLRGKVSVDYDWRAEDGGQLRLYLDESRDEEFHDVMPEGGTLVCFLSDGFWHEVLPATRARLSLTGWFRRRASL